MPMIHQSSCFGKATRPRFNKRNNAKINEKNEIAHSISPRCSGAGLEFSYNSLTLISQAADVVGLLRLARIY